MSQYADDDPNLEDLMNRADDDELERFAAHGRFPDCGRRPEAKPGFDECKDSDFHRPAGGNTDGEGDYATVRRS